MADDEDEERRRRNAEALLRQAATSSTLTVEEQKFLRLSADRTHDGLPLTWLERYRVRRLVGKVAVP
jgi:hypothetical protein